MAEGVDEVVVEGVVEVSPELGAACDA